MTFLRPKTFFYLTILIALFCFSPEQMFSQTPDQLQNQTQQETTEPKKGPSQPQKPLTQKQQQEKQAAKPAPSRTAQDTLKSIPVPSLITQAAAIATLSMLPFIIMMLTSFLKIVIVLSLLRSALGVQQAPPNQIINGIALMISLFVMYPTGLKMYEAAVTSSEQLKAPDSLISAESSTYILHIANEAKEPLRVFLKANSSVKHQGLFYRIAFRTLPEDQREKVQPDDFMILVPSYITSQLKDAFEIGVLIYIPFFVIDLVTSNVLLAMGMMMLSPVTISMPLKLFLLVMLDGWTLLIEGLVQTFR